MDRSYKELARLLGNVQDEGMVNPTDLLDMLDTLRTSVAVEAFRGVSGSVPLGVALNRDSAWDYKADWDAPEHDSNSVPDWFFLRSKLLTATGGNQFSRITGLLRPTTDNAGIKYMASSLSRVFLVQWSLYAETTHSMSGAVSFYRGSSWGSDAVRQSATPFDTGINSAEDGRFPFVLRESEVIVMEPGDELRWRFEYFGASAVKERTYTFTPPSTLSASVTTADDENPVDFITYLKQMRFSMVSLGVLDGFQNTLDAGGVAVPATDVTDILSDVAWRSSGMPERPVLP